MPAALLLGTLALILIRAGWKNQSIVDAALGREPSPKELGGDFSDPDATGGGGAIPNTRAGTVTIDGKPVALWIVPYVKFARKHGWRGRVTSGFRTADQQAALRQNPQGFPVAQGVSNHQRTVFPGGAVDVSDPDGFAAALAKFPGPVPLKQGTAIGDPIHFSATGR